MVTALGFGAGPFSLSLRSLVRAETMSQCTLVPDSGLPLSLWPSSQRWSLFF